MTQPVSTSRAPFLTRLGRACHERRRLVLALWLAALLVVGGLSGALGPGFVTEFSAPDGESKDGFEIVEEYFDFASGSSTTIVFEAEQGIDDPEVAAAMTELFDAVNARDDVAVVSPYSDEPGPPRVAPERTIAYATVEFPDDLNQSDAIEIRDFVVERLPEVDGLRVELGGQLFAEFEPPNSEALGLAFAVIILIFALGSVLAMGLSIGTALIGIGIGASSVAVLAHAVEMPDFTSFIAIMIGLGVGIDYALFIVNRYREELHLGRSEIDAVGIAINTAGRSVLFAGITVVISLLGMLLIGLSFINGLAIGSAVVVFVTMVASVTLLPALLGFAGSNIEVSKWRGVVVAGLISLGFFAFGLTITPLLVAFPLAVLVLVMGSFVGPLQRTLPARRPKPIEETFAYRWSRVIQRFPWPAAILSTLGLLVLAIPMLSLRLGFSDDGNYPEDTTTRQAYDLLAEGFGPGFNGPLLLAAEVPEGTDPEALVAVTVALNETDGVAFASPPQPNDPENPQAAVWQVIPASSPQDEATSDLVFALRDEVLPAATAGTDLDVAVTGFVAVSVDFSQYMAERMPVFLGAVLALSFLLLMVVFRSILVPLKAVLMNLLSIGAAYGIAVAVFQWGWVRELLAVDATGPIEPFIPMMMFAIVFGLSMDYEVFLLSRVKEEYDRGSSNAKAVADGLASTARVITAAAAIMVVVFGSFLLEPDRVVKLMGFGLAVAVLLDATVVRMVLVPATMELLGDRNWWLPSWLDRLLPKIDVEGHPTEFEEQDLVLSETTDPRDHGNGRSPSSDSDQSPERVGAP